MTLMDDATGVPLAEKARLIELAQGGDRKDALPVIKLQLQSVFCCTFLTGIARGLHTCSGQYACTIPLWNRYYNKSGPATREATDE